MRRIRETLRLHLQAGLSYSEIARALKLSKSVAGKYVSLGVCRRVTPGGVRDDVIPSVVKHR